MVVTIPVGRLTVATPETMAMSIRSNTVATAAVDERIEAVAAGIIADDPTVAAAAAAAADTAVADEVANGDLVAAISEVELTRSSRAVVPLAFRDKSRLTVYPSIYQSVYPPVTWSAGARRFADAPVLRADGTLSPDVIPAMPLGVLRELVVQTDPDGPIDLQVRPDGTTFIRAADIANAGGSGVSVRRAIVLAVLGQSNNVAYGHPTVPFLDHESSRIWQLPYGGDGLIPAKVPITGPGPASGLSPSHVLAREIVAADPECAVVLVPAAVGGSGLVNDPAGGRGKWEVGYTGPNPPLYAQAVDMTTRAIAQAQARWGVTPTTLATWIQGETDGAAGVTRSVYTAALDVLITDWRGRFPGMFLIAGIVPEYTPAGTRPEIILGLQDTPRRMLGTAYVPGVLNGGAARGPDDTNHFGREAVEIIGREWFKAIPRASDNIVGSPTQTPIHLEAWRWGGTVTATWSPPYCRVTAYEVQSSPDGVAWTNVPMPEPVATRVEFASAVPVKVRVRAIGTDTSNWSAPVNAIGG